MKMKYIVLYGPRTSRHADFRSSGGGAGGVGGDGANVPVIAKAETLDQREAALRAGEPGVAGVAPEMPMRLIAPLTQGPALEKEPGNLAWGVRAVRADTSPFNGNGVTVALLDTGIQRDHPAFPRDAIDIEEEDFTGEGTLDQNGHGTHCAGTIFGRRVDGTRIGVAPGVSKALIGKVLGKNGGSSQRIVDAIFWAADGGANVISMSLGIDFPGFVKRLVDQDNLPQDLAVSLALEGYYASLRLFETLQELLEARGRQVVLVAAAGNESRREESRRVQLRVAPPAAAAGFVSVAALGRTNDRISTADFSNTGALVGAPGVDIVSAGLKGGLATMSGTSMAAPHVAGVAALWAEKQLRRGPLKASQLLAHLVSNSTLDLPNESLDPAEVGSGLVQAPQH
jgi:subtilisin family serine protease